MIANKDSLHYLTGMRFFAAFFVLIFHTVLFVKFAMPEVAVYLPEVLFAGWIGVDFFFLLSGFILAYNYDESFHKYTTKGHLTFLYKRFARVYPVYIFTLMVLLFWVVYFSAVNPDIIKNHTYSSFTPMEFLANLFMIQAWDAPATISWNPVAWSVSAEWLAYVLFPLFIFVTKRIESRKAIYSFALLLYILMALSVLAFKFSQLHEYAVIRILCEFNIGVMIHKLFKITGQNEAGPKKHPWLKLFLFCVVVSYVSQSKVGGLLAVIVIPFLAWLILVSAQNRLALNGFLSKPLIVYGGKISYSLYLVHGLLFLIGSFILPYESALETALHIRVIVLAGIVISSIVLSIMSYHFVEKPARKFLLENSAIEYNLLALCDMSGRRI